jgi:protein Tex
MSKISKTISEELRVRRRAGRGGRAAARRGRHGALHRPLPQGGHRRPRRRPAAHPGGAAGLSARAGGAARAVLKSIEEQGKLTDELRAEIEAADTKQRLEDLYLPYKPKRRTKAQIAREAGWSRWPWGCWRTRPRTPETAGRRLRRCRQGRADAKAALEGARQILMERFAEDAELVGALREPPVGAGRAGRRVVAGKEQEGAKFSDYFDYREPVRKIPSHRALALFRGRNQGVLSLDLARGGRGPGRGLPAGDRRALRHPRPRPPGRRLAARDGAQDLAGQALTRLDLDLKSRLREAAEEEAIRVFARNLKALLLAAPAGPLPTLGLDPGCAPGSRSRWWTPPASWWPPTPSIPHPRNQWDGSMAPAGELAEAHGVKLVAIGNGTASRETDKLAAGPDQAPPELGLQKSWWSARPGPRSTRPPSYASNELPSWTCRCAARSPSPGACRTRWPSWSRSSPSPSASASTSTTSTRPSSPGRWTRVVEDCVNAVGVDLNTASAPLLARVAGLNATLAENIVRTATSTAPSPTASAAEGAAAGREDLRAVRRLPARAGRRRAARRLRGAPRGLPGGASAS